MESPLIIGTDVTNMTANEIEILSNPEAIAINQDVLGLQAFVVWRSNDTLTPVKKGLPAVPKQSVWAGPLVGGCFTGVLLNMESTPAVITLTRDMLVRSIANAANGSVPPVSHEFKMRDLWKKTSAGTFKDKWHSVVEVHGVVFLKLTPLENDMISV